MVLTEKLGVHEKREMKSSYSDLFMSVLKKEEEKRQETQHSLLAQLHLVVDSLASAAVFNLLSASAASASLLLCLSSRFSSTSLFRFS